MHTQTSEGNLQLGKSGRVALRMAAWTIRGNSTNWIHLWVYTPIIRPFPHSSVAVAINRLILHASIAVPRRWMGIGPFQLWSWVPTAPEYFGLFGESMIVYYRTDNWSQFSTADTERIERLVESWMDFDLIAYLADRLDVVGDLGEQGAGADDAGGAGAAAG